MKKAKQTKADKGIRELAAFLRQTACQNVQNLRFEEIRPFEQSSRVDGWLAVAAATLDFLSCKSRKPKA